MTPELVRAGLAIWMVVCVAMAIYARAFLTRFTRGTILPGRRTVVAWRFLCVINALAVLFDQLRQ
ncbi:MAG: hypothetical protein M3O85_00655 [Acidobacteriota bacterium]|nr:hypothetical protein [Acidobacteriota bacterium]